jgi:hypothetical protein
MRKPLMYINILPLRAHLWRDRALSYLSLFGHIVANAMQLSCCKNSVTQAA